MNFVYSIPNDSVVFNEVVYVAQVKYFTENGFLNCKFQCFLDMNYSDFKKEPVLYFQVGTKYNPTAFKNVELNKTQIESSLVEKVFNNNNYKLKLDFGKILVSSEFVARLVVVLEDDIMYVPLKPSSFKEEIIIMDDEKFAKEQGLCKAEQFLRKIDFDRLYKEYAYEE